MHQKVSLNKLKFSDEFIVMPKTIFFVLRNINGIHWGLFYTLVFVSLDLFVYKIIQIIDKMIQINKKLIQINGNGTSRRHYAILVMDNIRPLTLCFIAS